jgi:hypothetical protein
VSVPYLADYDADTTTLFASAFDRVGRGILAGNAISLVTFTPTMLSGMSTVAPAPTLRDVSVGAGPCSISVFVR